MDKKIINILKSFHINDYEIEDMKNMVPLFESIVYEDFIINCNLLIKYGYPKSDLDILFLSNPDIFVQNGRELEQKLIKLSKMGDIEMILKTNPLII